MKPNIQLVDIDDLRPHPLNPRIITQEAVNAVATSILTYGWRTYLVANTNGEIIMGNTRLRAAKKIRDEHPNRDNRIPVEFVDLPHKKQLALMTADNKVAQNTKWDVTKLPDILAEIGEKSFTGFDEKETATLLGIQPPPSEIAINTPPDPIILQFNSADRQRFIAALPRGKSREEAVYDAVLLAAELRRKKK